MRTILHALLWCRKHNLHGGLYDPRHRDTHNLLLRTIKHALLWCRRRNRLHELRHKRIHGLLRPYDSARAPVVHDEAPSTIGSQIWGTGTAPICSTTEFCTRSCGTCCKPSTTPSKICGTDAPAICSTTRSSCVTRSASSSREAVAATSARHKMVPPHLRLRHHFLGRMLKEAATSSEVGTGKPTPTRGWVPIHHKKKLVEPTEME